MRRWALWIPLGLLIGLLAVFASILGTPPRSPIIRADGDIRVEKPLPMLSLPLLGQTTTKSQDDLIQPGKVTILNFFASWCRPCLEEHGELSVLGARDDVVMVGVAWHDKVEAAKAFLDRQGNPFDIVLADMDGQTSMRWGLSGVPETFIINDRKQIIGHLAGPITADIRTRQIVPLIAEAAR